MKYNDWLSVNRFNILGVAHIVRIEVVFRLISVACIIFLASCSNNSTNSSPPPGCSNNLTPPPITSQHLYAGVLPFRSGDQRILQFTLPLTATSTPTVTVSTAVFAAGLAVDANGNIAVGAIGDQSGRLAVFQAPLSNSSTPSAVFQNGASAGNGGLAFSAEGDLFAPSFDPPFINLFTPPLTLASTPSHVIADSRLKQVGAAKLDSSGNLIVSNFDANAAGSNLVVFTPPCTGTSLVTPLQAASRYVGIALSSTQLFVADFSQQRVDVYNLPLTASSGPAFSITNGLSNPRSVAFDSGGNLYVGNSVTSLENGTGFINVYNQPLSASSAPSVVVTVPSASGLDVAIGR